METSRLFMRLFTKGIRHRICQKLSSIRQDTSQAVSTQWMGTWGLHMYWPTGLAETFLELGCSLIFLSTLLTLPFTGVVSALRSEVSTCQFLLHFLYPNRFVPPTAALWHVEFPLNYYCRTQTYPLKKLF